MAYLRLVAALLAAYVGPGRDATTDGIMAVHVPGMGTAGLALVPAPVEGVAYATGSLGVHDGQESFRGFHGSRNP